MKIKISFIHLVVFFYAILILLMIAAIINLHILINNFDINKHFDQITDKLVNKPELNKYENKTFEFGIKLIDREVVKSLTGLQLDGEYIDDEYIGKYIFIINDTLVIYDYRRDKIIHISSIYGPMNPKINFYRS